MEFWISYRQEAKPVHEDEIDALRPGPTRLIKALIDEIGIVRAVNDNVRWDEKQWKISPGESIAAIVLCIFAKRRALHRFELFFANQDLELLFGRKDLLASDFNDDCLGRALERLAESGFKTIFGTVVLNAQTAHGFTAETCHADTTSISVHGEYETEEAAWEEPPLFLTFGHAKKNNRPDLKQFKFGLLTNGEGVPIHGEPLDGNMDDKTWSRQIVDDYREFKTVLAETILVADAAAVTGPNLRTIAGKELRFVSRLPETFALCAALKEQALAGGDWTEARLPGRDGKEPYRLRHFEHELEGCAFRFVVVHSPELEKTKVKSIERAIAGEEESLRKALDKLSKQRFACLPDAGRAWEEFLARVKPRYHTLTHTVAEGEEAGKRKKPGRPPKEDILEPERYYALSAEIAGRDECAIGHTLALAKTFVLISSVPESEAGPAKLLEYYKEQAYIENRFRFLKNPYFVGPVFLKKPERVQALGYVLLLALLIYSLFERRVRQGLAAENEPYHLPGSYKTFRPCGETLLAELDFITILRIFTAQGIKRQLPGNISANVKRIVRLAGFNISIYTEPAVFDG